jgi:hypothetical protein
LKQRKSWWPSWAEIDFILVHRAVTMSPPINWPPQSPAGESTDGHFDQWPPVGWYCSEGDEDSSGESFRWDAPPSNFGVRAAYEWIDRVIQLYEHLQGQGVPFTTGNEDTRSALANAYALIDDLRRRNLVLPKQFGRWKESMTSLDGATEIRFLIAAREVLVREIEKAEDDLRTMAIGTQRPQVPNWRSGEVRLGVNTFHVDPYAALFLQVLIEADGEWISLPRIAAEMQRISGGPRPSHVERLRNKLRPPLREIIQVTPRGHRIS